MSEQATSNQRLPTTREWNVAWKAFYKSVARIRVLAERGNQKISIKVNLLAAPQRKRK